MWLVLAFNSLLDLSIKIYLKNHWAFIYHFSLLNSYYHKLLIDYNKPNNTTQNTKYSKN